MGTDMKHHANLTQNVISILEDGKIDDDEVPRLFKAIVHAADLSNPVKPSFTYNTAGTYKVTLIVSNGTTQGIKAASVTAVEINAKPETNQAVRWVMNKEKHADELSEIVTYYFMAQRIKPDCEDYHLKLTQLHQILVYSMKAKQSTDMANVEKLKELIHNFEHSYMGAEHAH